MVNAYYTQDGFLSDPDKYFACSASLTNGYATCEFEANHASGDYYFTVYYTGFYSDSGELVDAPSTATLTCVYPY
jgi:hypothetical protein